MRHGRFGVFGRWFVGVVDFHSLVPEILEVVSQLANVWNNITTSSRKEDHLHGPHQQPVADFDANGDRD